MLLGEKDERAGKSFWEEAMKIICVSVFSSSIYQQLSPKNTL